jgi:hypothetical protein
MHLQKLQLCKIETALYHVFANYKTNVMAQRRKRLLSAHHMFKDHFWYFCRPYRSQSRLMKRGTAEIILMPVYSRALSLSFLSEGAITAGLMALGSGDTPWSGA